jgi:hypothetical protein
VVSSVAVSTVSAAVPATVSPLASSPESLPHAAAIKPKATTATRARVRVVLLK